MARCRSLLAFALFTSAAVLAGFVPWAGFGLICLALVLHLKPDIGVRRTTNGVVSSLAVTTGVSPPTILALKGNEDELCRNRRTW